MIESFANFITAKIGQFRLFFFCQLAFIASFKFGSCPFGLSVFSYEICAIFQYLGVCQRLKGQRANKQFKWDSARVAFLICVWFFVVVVQVR